MNSIQQREPRVVNHRPCPLDVSVLNRSMCSIAGRKGEKCLGLRESGKDSFCVLRERSLFQFFFITVSLDSLLDAGVNSC